MGASGFARWAEATKETSQSLSSYQEARNVLRQRDSAEGGEGFSLGASAVEAMGAGRGVAITLSPVVVVRGKEGCKRERRMSSAAPSQPKRSPPSAEELCLKTFHSCWHLDKGWLVSFIASAQRKTPTSPITWVEFFFFFFLFFFELVYCHPYVNLQTDGGRMV